MAKTKKKSLRDRLDPNELYVTYSGMSGGHYGLVVYGDPERTPRIYSRNNLDPRLAKSSVCESLREANQALDDGEICVLTPLSEMVKVWSAKEVRRWADGNIDSDRIHEYVGRLDSR
ncbi:MAG: hypothetical protein KDA86_22390 [Planctomycetaceae bacterium]|nr:hypothetical protein [Planctomycetaceae bacterium]